MEKGTTMCRSLANPLRATSILDRSTMTPTHRILRKLVFLLATILGPTNALMAPWEKVQMDLAALTRRVTARHIMVANPEIVVALKRKIREEASEKEEFVVDVFEQAANKYSQDETTNFRGGLLGTLVPQGYCQSRELDRACFQVGLGVMEGPIKSEFGYHLVLVTERTNCPKLDGANTKLVQKDAADIFGTLVPAEQVGQVEFRKLVLNQAVFWVLTFLAGGVVAELAEKLASPVLR